MDNGSPFFITTAIDYPNSRPHIGTAFEKIGADVQARFRRMEGDRRPLPHGQRRKHDQGAAARPRAGGRTSAVRRRYGQAVSRCLAALDISYDDFIQTSEERHHIGCRKFIQAVFDAGDIYKGTYTGHYCTGCEAFKTEKEVEEGGGHCPTHPSTPLTWVEEENYFFRLSAYRDRLLAHYAVSPGFHPSRQPP